jgi:glycosyltransferase involved in cell wall biosynthesis
MKVAFYIPAKGGTGQYARLYEAARSLIKNNAKVYWIAPGMDSHDKDFILIKIRNGNICEALRLIKSKIDILIISSELDGYNLIKCNNFNIFTRIVFMQRIDTLANYKFHIHNSISFFSSIVWRVKSLIYPIVVKKFIKNIDAAVFQTPFALKDYEKLCGDILHKDTYILPNNSLKFWSSKSYLSTTRKDIGLESIRKRNVVAYIGNMQFYGKGVDTLIDAYDMLRKNIDSVLLLVGNIPKEFEEVIPLRISRSPYSKDILTLGHIENINLVFEYIDICVSASRMDLCPNSVLESIAYEKPIIASDIEAHKFLLHYDELLFEQGNKVDLCKSMFNLLSSEHEKNKNISLVKIRKKVLSFDWNKELYNILKNISRR